MGPCQPCAGPKQHSHLSSMHFTHAPAPASRPGDLLQELLRHHAGHRIVAQQVDCSAHLRTPIQVKLGRRPRRSCCLPRQTIVGWFRLAPRDWRQLHSLSTSLERGCPSVLGRRVEPRLLLVALRRCKRRRALLHLTTRVVATLRPALLAGLRLTYHRFFHLGEEVGVAMPAACDCVDESSHALDAKFVDSCNSELAQTGRCSVVQSVLLCQSPGDVRNIQRVPTHHRIVQCIKHHGNQRLDVALTLNGGPQNPGQVLGLPRAFVDLKPLGASTEPGVLQRDNLAGPFAIWNKSCSTRYLRHEPAFPTLLLCHGCLHDGTHRRPLANPCKPRSTRQVGRNAGRDHSLGSLHDGIPELWASTKSGVGLNKVGALPQIPRFEGLLQLLRASH
mmetsp:Transcript_120037/g.275017  ORF Transcript_120037/g.275017 Transcript_120037/m.275017 type:complete len:390 (+) Transcript_120037:835-2004(+)